uniref:Prepilin-type N-terminal cleavage/methylation domain-containing protein n=1 Tax=Magnetococcus massalia (strain MO-1) TaxID=451514 RepID=A0A1S7LDP0_MAGMO|nr:conserved protein of unknown function [Include Prokaryotic N-terminal methylation motif] [Candidatus Magnetococcus massalia]
MLKNGCESKRSGEQGFTLMEMAIVLVVIGLILGAVSIGKDLQRNAEYRKITNKFVGQWAQAYNQYYERTGVVPGDTVIAPTGRSNVAEDVPAFFEAAGIKLPRGNGNGSENIYLYFDKDGLPRQLTITFNSVGMQGSTLNTTETQNLVGNLMVVDNIAPTLFSVLDGSIDGIVDSDDGVFRCAQDLTADVSNEAISLSDEDGNQKTALTTCFYKMQQ